jgi:hypothetical protein
MMDENQIKSKLNSLYSSSKPQVFAQLHCDYDEVGHKITTATTRVYDLRAGAIVQILFADGLPKEVAIENLQAAIRHIETMDMPAGPILLPDGTSTD